MQGSARWDPRSIGLTSAGDKSKTLIWLHGQALRRPEHAEVLERVQRQVAAIEDLVKRFPLTNPKASPQPCVHAV